MKGNRVADLRAEASTNSRPDSKRGLKATIKLQQETIKTQTQQIETLKNTNQHQFKHGGSLEDNDARFAPPLGQNPFALASMASRHPFAGVPFFDPASKKLREFEQDKVDHLSKEPNSQPVAQSVFGELAWPLREVSAVPKKPDCSNCQIMETQQMEEKDLIQRLHQEIAEHEAIKEPKDSCIDEEEIDGSSQILEIHDAEIRDSYEAAFKAIFEGQQQEDKETIARLQSKIAGLEACVKRIGNIDNGIREMLDRLLERLDAGPEQVVMGPQEELPARLQEKMEKLDAALGRVTAAEDEEAKKTEEETTTEKRNEGRCIVS